MKPVQRREISISGVVQGVGFRPYVFLLATRWNLHGYVQNRSGDVVIEIEGDEAALTQFIETVQSQSPPLSRIESLSWRQIPTKNDVSFRIAGSSTDPSSQVFISPDLATCPDCRKELFDPIDRRFRYPFLNCTQCGPRLTIIHRAPYDRANTTMASFVMCDRCQAEYNDPNDRRFHAEPIACGDCGPQLQLLDESGQQVDSDDPLSDFCDAIYNGRIGALKGIGGYHLVCLATDEAAIHQLRQRKHRDEKPFAIMVQSTKLAASWCEIDAAEHELLSSVRRPIVLLRKRTGGARLSHAIAPNNSHLGVMLPYSPLHELLMDRFGDQPLVMTSGNRSDEPIVFDDVDAVKRLSGIADLFLVHNRSIRVRCDDSVTRLMDGKESPIRRSRGYAPIPIELPFACPDETLAVGGQLKNVFALACGHSAFLSHHVGDLDQLSAVEVFKRDIGLYEQLFEIQPQTVVHDLHPDYVSTAYALERGSEESLSLVGVQHHHAHLASCMVENRLDGQVIGVIFDGSGFASDNTVWGGEFLIGEYESAISVARLRRIRLPGSDKAAKEPWRMALSHLVDAECDVDWWVSHIADTHGENGLTLEGLRVVYQLIDTGFNSPWTSSAGRLFDAVAALVGARLTNSFEGQAAMQLEALALTATANEPYPFGLHAGETPDDPLEIDTRPVIRGVFDDLRRCVAATTIAARFHRTLSRMIEHTCIQIASFRGLDRVVLSGGVFMNTLLSNQVDEQLSARGFRVYQHHIVPPNDGGLCLGQLAIAARHRP